MVSLRDMNMLKVNEEIEIDAYNKIRSVPNGWIYTTIKGEFVAMVFVPETLERRY